MINNKETVAKTASSKPYGSETLHSYVPYYWYQWNSLKISVFKDIHYSNNDCGVKNQPISNSKLTKERLEWDYVQYLTRLYSISLGKINHGKLAHCITINYFDFILLTQSVFYHIFAKFWATWSKEAK